MSEYIRELEEHGWIPDPEYSEILTKFQEPLRDCNFDVEILVCQNVEQVNSILIYSYTTGKFENQKDVDTYLQIFTTTINSIFENHKFEDLFYIQNYNGFNPTEYIDYILKMTKENPLKEVLEKLPFENQRRHCYEVPQEVQEKMPNVVFNKNIEEALGELKLLVPKKI